MTPDDEARVKELEKQAKAGRVWEAHYNAEHKRVRELEVLKDHWVSKAGLSEVRVKDLERKLGAAELEAANARDDLRLLRDKGRAMVELAEALVHLAIGGRDAV